MGSPINGIPLIRPAGAVPSAGLVAPRGSPGVRPRPRGSCLMILARGAARRGPAGPGSGGRRRASRIRRRRLVARTVAKSASIAPAVPPGARPRPRTGHAVRPVLDRFPPWSRTPQAEEDSHDEDQIDGYRGPTTSSHCAVRRAPPRLHGGAPRARPARHRARNRRRLPRRARSRQQLLHGPVHGHRRRPGHQTGSATAGASPPAHSWASGGTYAARPASSAGTRPTSRCSCATGPSARGGAVCTSGSAAG